MRTPFLFMSMAMLVPLASCSSGLEPPAESGFGRIEGTIEYTGSWPPPDQLHDLRFVGMRFVPQDTTDFLQLNRMAISSTLAYNVDSDTFVIEEAMAGDYVYSGIAIRTSEDLLSWRPVGLYDENGGHFTVRSGETVQIALSVDFNQPPDFPPQ